MRRQERQGKAITWFAAGAAVIGAGASIYSNNKAAGQQAAGAANANNLLSSQYQDTVGRNQPFVTGGTSAYNALLGRLGLAGTNGTDGSGYGTLGQAPTAAQVEATPGYQFGLNQGQSQLNRQENASGMSYSGAQLKAASQYGTNYATNGYQQAFNNLQSGNQQVYNQLAGTAGMGQNAINSDNGAGAQYAGAASNNITGAANSAASATLADGNSFNNLLNQGTSIYKNSSAPNSNVNQGMNSNGSVSSNSSIYTDPSSMYGQNGSDVGIKFADGGQVRSEPVIGSRTPLPGATAGSTGGGMSRDALIAALMAPPASAPQRTGVGALPVNPLMRPGAITANQMQQAGAYAKGGAVQAPPMQPAVNGQMQGPVYGPGGPKDDAIPVQMSNGQQGALSNKEHVVDEAAVTGLGNGDNALGQQKLNMLRAHWKGKK